MLEVGHGRVGGAQLQSDLVELKLLDAVADAAELNGFNRTLWN